MAPRRNIHPNEPPSQNPDFSRPGKPTLTLPSSGSIPTGGLYSYYPETQSKGMESSMRPRGGFVDSTLPHVFGTDTGCVSPKPPQKNFPKLGSVNPASDSNAGGPSKRFILPLPNKIPTKEREDKEQENQQGTEDDTELDTVDDFARIVDNQAINGEKSDETLNDDGSITIGIEKREIKPLNQRLYAPPYPFQTANPSTNPAIHSHLPVPQSSPPHRALQTLNFTPAATRLFHCPLQLEKPSFFLPLVFFIAAMFALYCRSRLYRARSGTAHAKHTTNEERRCARDEKTKLVDEEQARWEVAETFGVWPSPHKEQMAAADGQSWSESPGWARGPECDGTCGVVETDGSGYQWTE